MAVERRWTQFNVVDANGEWVDTLFANGYTLQEMQNEIARHGEYPEGSEPETDARHLVPLTAKEIETIAEENGFAIVELADGKFAVVDPNMFVGSSKADALGKALHDIGTDLNTYDSHF